MSGLTLLDRTRSEVKEAIADRLAFGWPDDVDYSVAEETAELAILGMESIGITFVREGRIPSGLWK